MRTGVTGVEAQRLAQAIQMEAGILEEFAREQDELLGTVRSRSWADLERKLEALRVTEGRVQAADRERVDALPPGEGDAASFARIVRNIEAASRAELERSYHALSLAVLRVKAATSRLDHYVGAVMGSLDAVLGELLPYRKGRMYCSKGQHRQAAEVAIVVDTKK